MNSLVRGFGEPWKASEDRQPFRETDFNETKIYLCGPISGFGDLNENIALFKHVAQELRSQGYEVYCPPEDENVLNERLSWSDALRKDIPHVVGADKLVLLPNWHRSRGARLEVQLAQDLDIEITRAVFLDGEFMDSHEIHPSEIAAELREAQEVEERITNPDTGGMKGKKLPQLAWCPPDSLWELAKAYGAGALKYSPTNFRAGYNWSLSANAMYRHFLAWQMGESIDEETGVHHLALAAWHCMALMYFEKTYPELDDVRWVE